jgi:hypothetical protein
MMGMIMINSIFPFPVQAASNALGVGENSPNGIVSPFESSALWIDDEQWWWLGFNF